jgi:hypothetical protein
MIFSVMGISLNSGRAETSAYRLVVGLLKETS